MSQLQQHRPGSAYAEFEILLEGDKQREVLQRCAKEEQFWRVGRCIIRTITWMQCGKPEEWRSGAGSDVMQQLAALLGRELLHNFPEPDS